MLRFEGAVKHFGALTALDGCTFVARPGRLTGFLGPNGAGKTTAMRAVFGLVTLDAGTVTWRGDPIRAAGRSRFGYMPEERGLYPRMHVREQLLYLGELCGRPAADVGRVADRWLEQLGLSSRADARVDELSHGNQQRVQLIAALVNQPDVLVLDEPFAGLDPLAMDAMGGLLEELATTGVTVLFSSHQLDLVEDLCHDVVILDHGRVVLAGELEELRAASTQRVVDIRFRGREPRWGELRHVQVRESSDGHVRLSVDRAQHLQALLAQLHGSDEVVSFSYQPPTLSDLFTRAVAS
ncbi:MAG: ATP-binding cassette domain-containing protein [Nocardioides sp.]|nr:ATP-binding cassette domain-containing protein [Nocardioides sp.]